MKKKAILYLLLMPLMALVATSCDKDEEGYYLSSVYSTASYDGANYIDRARSKVPGVFPGIPSPDSQLLTSSSAVADKNIFPVLFITTWLKPVDENMQQSFDLNIYLRNIQPDKNLVGREFAITSSEAFTRDKTSEALSIIARDKIDIVAMYYHKESIYDPATFISCEGTLSITEYDESNNRISGEFSLSADGKPLKGNFYKISLGNN